MERTLLARLTSDDEEVRAEAREQLALDMDDEIARAFLDIARGGASEEIRAEVIVGLGPIIEEAGDEYFDGAIEFAPEFGPSISRRTFETILSEIRALYDDAAQPKLVRRRALEVLVRDPRDWQKDEVRKQFDSPDEEWKRTAVFAMGCVPGFEAELQSLVASAEEPLLYEAVRSAGLRGLGAEAERIRALAESPRTERELRLVAIEALPAVDPDAGELLEKLAASKDEEIAVVAEDALEELGIFADDDDWDEE